MIQRRPPPDHGGKTTDAVGNGAPCSHGAGECDVAELWPIGNETDEQFKARLRAKYGRLAPIPGGTDQ